MVVLSRPRCNQLLWLYLLHNPIVTTEPTDHSSSKTPHLPQAIIGPTPRRPATECRWNPPGPLCPRASTSCPPLIDDNTNTTTTTITITTTTTTKITTTPRGTWGPWTHAPYCIAGNSDAAAKTRYCAFTSHTFRSGRGFSFIGTPQSAAELVGALADPWHSRFPSHVDVLADNTNTNNNNNNGSSSSSIKTNTYTVIPIPGKGLGVVATRRIRAGEVLMADNPLLVADVAFADAVAPDQGRELLRLAVERLPLPELLFGLARSRGRGGDDALIEDILSTNTFGVGIGGAGDYMGLYPEIARINHDCSPNSFSRFHPSDLTMDVGAMRDIMPGEEITISYIPLGLPSAQRAQQIRNWGFTCTCHLCSTAVDNQLSDQYRERLGRLRGQLMHNHREITASEVHRIAEEMMEIVDIERVFPQLGGYCEMVAQVLFAKGDDRGALRYLGISLDAWLLYGGEDHAHVPNVRSNLRDLEDRVMRDGTLAVY